MTIKSKSAIMAEPIGLKQKHGISFMCEQPVHKRL